MYKLEFRKYKYNKINRIEYGLNLATILIIMIICFHN